MAKEVSSPDGLEKLHPRGKFEDNRMSSSRQDVGEERALQKERLWRISEFMKKHNCKLKLMGTVTGKAGMIGGS